ncbi:hypothetical protein RMR10_026110 (plasmid) [Agrobacterium rosae]|uniref:hypothetical protein n=1 Tax=Agrobacterium rosae TaxID=1972867 RepID=UPI002A12768F|nr:hypothetical protein [Agrobacterium rosae]MDX8316051.1 hypothetical protein [Agrobacterium rosae]
MKRTIITALVSCAMATQAFAVPAINKDYVKSLAAPGKTALVIEYYDGNGKVVDRKGYATASGFKAVSGTDFKIDDKTTVHLYGLQACKGDLVNRTEDYAGTCDDYALKQLQVMLQSPKVVFCRAFVSEQGAPMQNATCYGYYNYPGAMDSVDNFEEQLLSLGALRLAKKPDGSVERPDLQEAENLGKKGDFGMWADPRVKSQ